MFKILKNKFNYCKDIDWSDVIDKINYEFGTNQTPYHNRTCKCMFDEFYAPSFVLGNHTYLPGTLSKVCDRVNKEMKTTQCHVYASLGTNSPTFGRHCDSMDVLIIQSIGSMSYMIDDNDNKCEIVDLDPGDGVIIEKGIYHSPVVKKPRITLSFSWD